MAFRSLDTLTRRQMMCQTAQRAFGLTILPGLGNLALAAEQANGTKAAPAQNLIYIRLGGAISHIDTFDPKPGRETQGETKSIQTKIPGVLFSEYLPKLATMNDQMCVIRSMNTPTADHNQASYLQQTSYRKIASITHPGMGVWAHKLFGPSHHSLPSTVQIGGGVGAGYMGAMYSPVPIGEPNNGLQNTKMPSYLTNDAFDKRMELSSSFDKAFRDKASGNSQVRGYDDLYNNAITLLRSEDLKAFDLKEESPEMRQKYGDNRFGRALLLARRLTQNGIRCVEVNYGGFDHHTEIWTRLPSMAEVLDSSLAALFEDLKSTGLDKHTLVAVASEFGRTPNINQRSGRDHHPAAFSAILGGAGIKNGAVYGKTDADAFHVEDDGVEPNDFNATIARCLGIDPKKEVYSPSGRPFKVGDGSLGIDKILA